MNQNVPQQDKEKTGAAERFVATPPDFNAAARHSARVRWTKRLLPIAVGAAALAIGLSALLSRLDIAAKLPVDLGRLTLSGTRLTMEQPHLSGFTDDERGYSVTASSAEQDLKNPDYILLDSIEARIELAEKGWAQVNAKGGKLNIKSQEIFLNKGVDLAMNGGFGGHLKDAHINPKKGSLVTKKPVLLTYNDAKLVADRLTVSDSGDKAVFEGHVQVDFQPSKLNPPEQAKNEKPANANRPGNTAPAPGMTAPKATAPAQPSSVQEQPPQEPAPAAAPSTGQNGATALPPAPLPRHKPAQLANQASLAWFSPTPPPLPRPKPVQYP
ncbi:LPS export ABC transporter periplasmic protein LptC [Xanthobacter sp. TB0139]|uniref:LPS export ABC transporter periplasmic protein LptC n=1 Tax=Xanthobacter sp. TB0139 TaxID=3459178 RepID=UPI00403A2521